MKLDRQLKQLIRDSDTTVARLGRATGVSSKTIYNWLEGQTPRDIDQVKKVADHLSVTLDFICYGVESKPSRSAIEEHRDEIFAGTFEVVLRRPKK